MPDPTRETVRFNDLKWIAPVENVRDLPEVENSDVDLLCYVQGEDAVYRLSNGVWTKKEEIGQ